MLSGLNQYLTSEKHFQTNAVGEGRGTWGIVGDWGVSGPGPGREGRPGHPLGAHAQAPAMAGAYEEGKGGFGCRRSGGRRRAAAEGGTMSIQSLGGVAPKFGGLTLTNGMSPLQDSQLAKFGPVGGFPTSW